MSQLDMVREILLNKLWSQNLTLSPPRAPSASDTLHPLLLYHRHLLLSLSMPQPLTLSPCPYLRLCPQVSAAEISAICQEAGMHAVRKNRCEYVWV